jgi:Fe-S-cluster containining protein
VLPDGSCSHLTNNRCAIYDTRPLVCRIGEGRAVLAPDLTQAEWYALNADACNAFQQQDGVDESFRVKIDAV